MKNSNNLLLYVNSNCNNRNRLKLRQKFKLKYYYFILIKKNSQILIPVLKLILLINCLNLFLTHNTLAQQQQKQTDDLTFNYRDKMVQDDPIFVKTTRRPHLSRPSRTSSTKTSSKTSSTQKTTTSKSNSNSNLKQTPPFLGVPSSITPPFVYSTESLNQTHANMFKNWIDTKSNELYELSMNFSGYKLLNTTYNVQLRKDANFAWINFTEMIINISSTISEVLNHKTLIVKNLTDLVEKAFDEYRNDTKRVKDSAHYLYYDAKSPKTFCDVKEASSLRSSKNNLTLTTTKSSNTASTPSGSTLASSKLKEGESNLNKTETKLFKEKRSFLHFDEDLDIIFDPLMVDYNFRSSSHNTSTECPYIKLFPHIHHNTLKQKRNAQTGPKDKEIPPKVTQKPGQQNKVPGGGKGGGKGPRPRPGNMSMSRTTLATTTPGTSLMYDDMDERTDLGAYDYFSIEYELSEKSPFWNISCINRTFDENFKNFQKGVNRNQSTVHVPTNVYKQDMDINMTAYWTENLDDLFKVNYENDNELFWQYFCSSNGLFRRYPGAYWTVPQNEDFFDCRLQSWYIMAAASPKDVLILLDTSGSMTGLRLEIAKKLVEAIMDTLSDNDFFNILLFSNTADYLMNKDNETQYRGRFIQAGRTNKKVFIDRLKWYKNTSNVADFDEALKKSFELLLNTDLQSDSCGCNKAIMILTDGASENAEQVFKKYNWNNGRQVRVFTFLIGRDMMDTRQVEWMACANDGKFFHVATLADVNEHVHEYIPVLSRPMALLGHHETTWSNVFVGHLDKELKIAVARPAFKTRESLLAKVDLIKSDTDHLAKGKTSTTTRATTTTESQYDYSQTDQEYDDAEYGDTYYAEQPDQENAENTENKKEDKKDTEATKEDEEKTEEELIEERNTLKMTDHILREQQVLLGVVGVDVPVLRLISKVSPKYQMGVGIYIIMLDNNGFIVFHPSIKKEIASNDFNFKGTSNSIDLDRFEIPINNDEDFEQLEHEMIDQITNNKTLDNWKREGLRVIRRRTEYVYTHVSKTPFSVAIASPSSFGRYYIDLPSGKESEYERKLKDLLKNKFDSNIQLYNCSYNYSRLAEKILNPKQYMDYCIRYLFQDKDQVLAIKSDLVFHDIYYNLFNFSIFSAHPNLIRSSFYGTYSGITFYLPVTFYRALQPSSQPQTLNKHQQTPTSPKSSTSSFDASLQPGVTEPPSEMTINVELGSLIEPFFKTSTKPTLGDSKHLNQSQLGNESETFHMSLNLFSTENNKHTYSFEKQYYTRSIEFSDYLRTSYNMTKPVVNYFLNESSKETRRDTVGATIPIWLDKVPTAVTGVVYDAHLLQNFLFENFIVPDCDHISCRNLCSQKRGMNMTCYLVDEHGIVVLSTQERLRSKEPIMGQPLYKVNPWLMKILEFEGVYDLVIPGKMLPECKQQTIIFNSSSHLTNFLGLVLKLVYYLCYQCFVYILGCFYVNKSSVLVSAQSGPQPSLADRIRVFNNEWRGKNSHCYNFGVYSFNLTKWNGLDSSELRVWCNSTNNVQRRFLVGHVVHSNLIMLVVEEEFELIHCGNISQLIKAYRGEPVEMNVTNGTNETETSFELVLPLELSFNGSLDANDSNKSVLNLKKDFTINRYRKKPDQCYNVFPNEKEYLPCMSKAVHSGLAELKLVNLLFIFLLLVFVCYFEN